MRLLTQIFAATSAGLACGPVGLPMIFAAVSGGAASYIAGDAYEHTSANL